jgi:addiction module HigA family antidote
MDTAESTLTPTHPGLLLRQGLQDLNLTISRAARETGIPLSTLSAIVRGRRPISAEAAIRLGRYLHTSARYWTNLQSDYDLRVVTGTLGETIEREVVPHLS